MTLYRIIITVLLIFGFVKSEGQNYELGKVCKAELEQKGQPKYSFATAALFKKKQSDLI